jgi:hypothetical protein
MEKGTGESCYSCATIALRSYQGVTFGLKVRPYARDALRSDDRPHRSKVTTTDRQRIQRIEAAADLPIYETVLPGLASAAEMP